MKLEPFYPVQLVCTNNKHEYKIGDSPDLHPSVTGILNVLNKPFLVPWAAKEAANKIKGYLKAHAVNRCLTAEEIDQLVEAGRKEHEVKKEAAADLGTRAHKAIDQIIRGEKPEVDDDIKPCVDAFLDWYRNANIRIALGDTKIGSMAHGYGGSLDAMGFQGDLPVILDWKTSNAISDTYAYQVAAYGQAFMETYGVQAVDYYILRLGKTKPEFEVRKLKNPYLSFRGFLHALSLYRHEKEPKWAA